MKNEILKNLWCLMELHLLISMVNSKTSNTINLGQLIIGNQTIEEILDSLDRTIIALETKLLMVKELYKFYKSDEKLN